MSTLHGQPDHIAFFFLSVAVLSSASMELVKLMDAQLLHGLTYPRESQFVHLGLMYLLLSGMVQDGAPRVFDEGLITLLAGRVSEIMRLYGLAFFFLKLLPALGGPVARTLVAYRLTKLLTVAVLLGSLFPLVKARIEAAPHPGSTNPLLEASLGTHRVQGEFVRRGLRHPRFQGSGKRVVYPAGRWMDAAWMSVCPCMDEPPAALTLRGYG